MNSITLTAPAKVNLFLKVLNKRKDGYHNIVTVFEKISIADRINISKTRHGITLSSDKFITKNPEDNIAYKAAQLMLRAGDMKTGVRIKIRKRIPLAAGLGGGSSDAAAVLIGINKLYNMKLKKEYLTKLASKLGADVPLFLFDGSLAIGKGIGDHLEGVKHKLELWHLIVYPGPKVATGRIYEAFDRSTKGLTGDFHDDKITANLLRSMDFNALESMLYNNLEKIAVGKKLVTGSILKRLAYSTGRKTLLAGSGPSVFCLCRTRKEAIEARERFLGSVPAGKRKNWQVFVAKTA